MSPEPVEASALLFRFFRAQLGVDGKPIGNGHVALLPCGRLRLATPLFVNNELSFDDGARCTPLDTQRRNPGCGVASVPKAKMAELGLQLEPRPDDTHPANDAHVVVTTRVKDKLGKKIRKAAKVVLQPPGLEVLDGDAEA